MGKNSTSNISLLLEQCYEEEANQRLCLTISNSIHSSHRKIKAFYHNHSLLFLVPFSNLKFHLQDIILLTAKMEKYLAKHPLEQILDEFRTVYFSYFTIRCDTVSAKPNNSCQLLPDVTNNIESRIIKLSYRIEASPFDLAPYEPLATLILTNATGIQALDTRILRGKLSDEVNFQACPYYTNSYRAENETFERIVPQACERARILEKNFLNKSRENKYISLAKGFMKRTTEGEMNFPTMKAVETKIFDQPSKSCDTSTSVSSSNFGGDENHHNKNQSCTASAHGFNDDQIIREVDEFI
ncbi:unnamed protein product [Blumeria hordei]|uniref:Uncharacterized protein n=1 Tax=Blumeria hordei TaxID=2867405 RepID=A0A383UNS5_BLUHO|nr:unnamed protein product [Blumeria hordei]